MVSTINATSASGVVTTADNSTTLALQTNSTNALYIDASQNVGIGTSSPVQKLDVSGVIKATLSSNTVYLNPAFGGANPAVQSAANNLLFCTLDSERMRIDSSGNLLVGTTSSVGGAARIGVLFAGNATDGIHVQDSTTTSGAVFQAFSNSSGTIIGSISRNGTTNAVLYNTTSDYRLKENVKPLQNSLSAVLLLNPVKYTWKNNGGDGEGFIAHELQEIIPLAVTGEKDAVDEDGNIKPQGVDYSKIVVHLVAAIQELTAKVTALEAKVGA